MEPDPGKHAAMAKRRKAKQRESRAPRFWGRHAVLAAMDNPARTIRKLWATHEGIAGIDVPPGLQLEMAGVADLGRLVPQDAPHQGLVIEVEPLEDIGIEDLLAGAEDGRPLVILDQVTDPHNAGAIMRSALAFNALGLVTQDRHAPPESGALAKSASGALEVLPWCRVVNLARALDQIAEAGFWRIGLAGEGELTLSEALGSKRVALVLGAEGAGMRPNTASHCDAIARLPISDKIESLNVSNAAAIALYAAATSG
jgi:23S rRNA (guanosine2251-2'-O)-methyltransferase